LVFKLRYLFRARGLISGWVYILNKIKHSHEPFLSSELIATRDRAVEFVDLHFRLKPNERLVQAPDAVAAAALYIACIENNVKVTQLLISCLAGRTETWLRDNYKKLWKELKLRDYWSE
jgi:hypothetical protein